MSNFCEKNSESIINWGAIEHGGIFSLFKGSLTFEQKLWMSVQSRISKNEQQKFIADIAKWIITFG